MRLKSFYGLFEPTKTANIQTLPPFYDEDCKLILDYYEFVCKRVGGPIEFAKYLKNLFDLPRRDADFVKAYPQYAGLAEGKANKKKKPVKAS